MKFKENKRHSKMNFSRPFFRIRTNIATKMLLWNEMNRLKYNFGITIEFDFKYVFLLTMNIPEDSRWRFNWKNLPEIRLVLSINEIVRNGTYKIQFWNIRYQNWILALYNYFSMTSWNSISNRMILIKNLTSFPSVA